MTKSNQAPKEKKIIFMGMEVLQRDWMPKNEIWITPNEELVIENVEFKNMKGSNQYQKKQQLVKKYKMDLKPRRHGVLKNVK